MSSTITSPSQLTTYHRRWQTMLALLLALIDVPSFLLRLWSYLLTTPYARLDPIGDAHRMILVVWLGGSTLCALSLLWRGRDWQRSRVIIVCVLSLSWLGLNQVVPRIWPNPVTRESCLASHPSELGTMYCQELPSKKP